MNLLFRRITTIMVFANILLGLCSCGMAESYKEFSITNITGYDVDNYISADELDFARVQGITMIPEIKEIRHGVYIIYISAYSKDKPKRVEVKELSLAVDNKVVLKLEDTQRISLESNQDNIYEGTIDGGTFTEDDIDITDGQQMDLIIQVEVAEDEQMVTKDVLFRIEVRIFKSFVVPT